MILAAVSTMVVTMAPAIPAYAYGEADSKTGQAAFNAATTGSADYQSWLTGTWQGGTQDFANTNKIALTPGSTAKDLGFAWYSNTKGTPAVMVWKDGSKAFSSKLINERFGLFFGLVRICSVRSE